MKLSHRWQGEADYDSAAERLAAARAALGPAARLMVDCYLSWPPAVADRMAELLAPYAPYWFEDVATPEHLAELAALRPRVKPVCWPAASTTSRRRRLPRSPGTARSTCGSRT